MSLVLVIIAILAVAFAVAGIVSSRRWMHRAAAAERRERALARSGEHEEGTSNGVFERLPVTAARVAEDGRVLGVTRLMEERFPDVTAGETLMAAFGSHELVEVVEAAVVEGIPRTVELRLFGTDRRTYRADVQPYAGSAGPEVAVVLADLSEAVAYQELRSQFVANVSHELRTPLTGLRGLLEALEDEDVDGAARARLVERATGETRRLEAIIVDVLFLSELEATQAIAVDEVCDLADAVTLAVDEAIDLAREQGVALALDVPEAAWIPLTSLMAHTVARNLVENAARYAGPGATARVTVIAGPAEVTLTVADDGAGIPERHLPHVFERFYRADPSRSRELGGTGLGLSIVKHIAERFGGRAEAHSREGYGAEFVVTLPAAVRPGADPDASVSSAAPGDGGR